MPPSDWLNAARRGLPSRTKWTDADLAQLWREGFTPAEAASELAFRELAAS